MAAVKDLWKLVWGQPYIDPADLTTAIEEQVRRGDLDYRSRLLIRDSLDALERYWGAGRFHAWIAGNALKGTLRAIVQEEFERPGFPTLKNRVMDPTKPEVIEEILRTLGVRLRLRKHLRIYIGGSIALILPGLVSRPTEDIDVVDEVPEELRKDTALLGQIEAIYGIKIGHFQQHYLPMRWQNRAHYHNAYGDLQVYLIDPGDVFLSKLSSRREKDLQDLRVLKPQLDKAVLEQRLKDDCQSMLATEFMREPMAENWYILYGEQLPT